MEICFKNYLFFRSEEKERIDYDDPHISFFWKAHTTSVLIFLILVGFYVGVIEDPNGNDAEFNSKRFGLSSFQRRDTKLDRFLAKNHHTQRKLMCFENRNSAELSKIGHDFWNIKCFKIGR